MRENPDTVHENQEIPRNARYASVSSTHSSPHEAIELAFSRKSHEYKALKSYWKLIQQDSRRLSDKRFYRPTFRMHLTNQEIVAKLPSYSQELKEHYELYQLLVFQFQEKQAEQFFGLVEETLSSINPIFQTIFETFLKDKDKIVNGLELPYSNAKLEATNNLIKVIKRNAFGFRKMKTLKLSFSLH